MQEDRLSNRVTEGVEVPAGAEWQGIASLIGFLWICSRLVWP